jgi:hypothetical protein
MSTIAEVKFISMKYQREIEASVIDASHGLILKTMFAQQEE